MSGGSRLIQLARIRDDLSFRSGSVERPICNFFTSIEIALVHFTGQTLVYRDVYAEKCV